MSVTRAELELICRSALAAASPSLGVAEVAAGFYPYIGLTHTIRRRGQGWEIRISDHCADAPRAVLEAVATILACKLARRRVPRKVLELYDRYRLEPVILERLRGRRLARGRKRIDTSPGRHHRLDEIFADLSAGHFGNRLEVARIGWGPASWTRLGHYDSVHQTITISRVLDAPRVPRSVVAYIVYHEMLHAAFDLPPVRGRRRDHPPEFRRAERAYPDFAAARAFLRDYCRSRPGRPRRKVRRGPRGSA